MRILAAIGLGAFLVACGAENDNTNISPDPTGYNTGGQVNEGGMGGEGADGGMGGDGGEETGGGGSGGMPGAPPQVDVVECDKIFSSGPTVFLYAEAAYPGKTAVELSRLSVVITAAPGVLAIPPGYEQQQSVAALRDGAAAVNCGVQSSPTATQVTFVLPSD